MHAAPVTHRARHRRAVGHSRAQWDALHDGRNPFVAHAFLSGLEAAWRPARAQRLDAASPALWDGDALVAAAPGYLKANSHGEFVFDHAWAHAYARYGRDVFPEVAVRGAVHAGHRPAPAGA